MTLLYQDHTVVGVFPDNESAEQAYQAVTDRGIPWERVTVLMKDDIRLAYYTEPEHRRKTAEGAGVGGAVGAGLGGLVAGLVAAGSPITIPGLFVAGALAGALTGAGAGGVGGGIIGALVGAGMKESVAREYESEVDSGNITLMVTVADEDDAVAIESAWQKIGHQVRRQDALRGSERRPRTA